MNCRSNFSPGAIVAQATILLLAVVVPPAAAQPGNFQWLALDSAPPGTPPTILLQTQSSPQQTVLDVTLHGFYYETIVRLNQTFRRLSLDKMRDEALYRAVGRPELPALHQLIGALVGVQPQPDPPVFQLIDEVSIPGALIYPYQMPRNEDQPATSFQWDQAFYQQMSQPWPPQRGAHLGSRGRWDGLELAAAEAYPFRVVPATQTLLVARHFIVTITHNAGNTPVTRFITRRQARQYQIALANAPVVAAFRPTIATGLAGDYLIVTDPLFLEEIDPLADQKRERGYTVTIMTTDHTGNTCDQIKTAIADWWHAGNPERDHYVLLVGDVERIAICGSENFTASDKVYACIDGLGDDGRPDVYPEVRLGRFSCDTELECTDMVTKTLAYEAGFPGSGSWLSDVLLACHAQAEAASPNTYRDAQEAVRSYPFSAPQPVFSTLYGQDGATNAQVRASVDAGKGVVSYRGHGSATAWSSGPDYVGWNLLHEQFDVNQVGLLANGIRTPVVFAIACNNNGIHSAGDAIGEKWMKTTQRAVAHFGASQCSARDANDLLDLELFETIWEDNHPILGEAIAGAEVATIISYPGNGEANAWQYLLLGDPELKVWREPPLQLTMSGQPASIPTGPTTVLIQVHRNGMQPAPVEFAIVSLSKEGEVAENRYTDANGFAQVPIDPTTPGIIRITAYTEFGSEGVALGSIEVTQSMAVGEGGAPGSGVFALVPPATGGALELGVSLPRAARGLRVRVVDVAGRLRASEAVGALAAGEHRLGLGTLARSLPRGIYWIEAKARYDAEPAGEARAQARWLKLR